VKQRLIVISLINFLLFLALSSIVQAVPALPGADGYGKNSISESGSLINVPADYATIAEAVVASESGDTILVQPGTYSIDRRILIGKSITIASLYHTTGNENFIDQTILDCRSFDEGQTVYIWEGSYSNGEKHLSAIDPDEQMFVVLKEDPGEPVVSGRFIGLHFVGDDDVAKPIVSHGELSVSHCHISDFHSDAISFESYGSGSGYVGYCTVENSGDEAIDIDATHGGTFEIEHNSFKNGRGDDLIEIRLSTYTGSEAGEMVYNIHHNSFEGTRRAGIQLIDYDKTTARMFSIHHNIFNNMGITGVSCMAHKNTVENGEGAPLQERVFVYNNTFDHSDYCLTGGENMIVLNNIFTNCSEVAVKGVKGDSIVDHNIFFNNGTDVEDSTTGASLLYADPLIDASHRLQENSPGIDAGASFYEWMGETVLDIPSGDYVATAPDLGAFEFGEGSSTENTPPNVFAGFATIIAHPENSITMTDATATDDGLPENSLLTLLWSKVSGPGGVSFDDAASINPLVTFETQGEYTLLLTATDGEFTSNATVNISYVQDGDGAAITIDMPSTVCFEAENYSYLVAPVRKIFDPGVSDGVALEALTAGSGYADYRLTTTGDGSYKIWLLLSGEDENSNTVLVSFKGDSQETVSVDPDGTYKWVEMEGALSTTAGNWPLVIQGVEAGVKWDRICISTDSNYIPQGGGTSVNYISVPINSSTDDAEEGNTAPGRMYLNSSDLELVTDDVAQTVGLRFQGIAIPRGATIISASVQFTVDENGHNAASELTIHGQASPDAATFTSEDYDISSRPQTGSFVTWIPGQWEDVGDAEAAQKTPDLSTILQEIVNQDGWQSGNGLAFIITGTGKRVAEAFDGDSEAAPMLTVKYQVIQGPGHGNNGLFFPITTTNGKVLIIHL